MALEQKGQKVGALRYAGLDVKQLMGVARLESAQMMTQAVEVASGVVFSHHKEGAIAAPTPPMSREKITVSATAQCAFQIL